MKFAPEKAEYGTSARNAGRRKRARRLGGVCYFWLLSMLLLAAVSLLVSQLIRTRATEILREERVRAEAALVETMTMVSDREYSAVTQYAARAAEDENVRAFLASSGMETAEEKLRMKQVFDGFRMTADRPAGMKGLYLVSLRNGYLLSANEGSNAADSRIFDYERAFGCDGDTFRERLRNLHSTVLFLPRTEGEENLDQIYHVRVVVERGSVRPLGYVLIPCRFPREALSTEEGTICGLLLRDGRIWDMSAQRFLPEEESRILAGTENACTANLDGETYLVTGRRSAVQDWTYLRAVRSSLFYGQLLGFQRFAGLWLLAGMAACLVLAVFFSQRNYHPVLQLVENLSRTEGRKRITDVNFQWIEERYQGLQASHDRLSGMLEKEKSLIVNNLFLRLLKGYYHSDYEVESAFSPYLIEFSLPRFRLILWTMEDDSGLTGENETPMAAYTADLLYRHAAETALACTKRIAEQAWAVDGEGLIFLLCNYSEGPGCLEEDFARSQEEARESLKKETGIGFAWFLSGECGSPEELPGAYMACIERMRQWNLGEDAREEPDAAPREDARAEESAAEKGSLAAAAMDYVNAHLYDPGLSLTQIANEFGITESHLSRLIRREFDIQLMSYVNAKRIERAAWMLEHTDLTLNEIAAETGFSTYRTLLRVFGQYYPMTPTQSRRGKQSQAAADAS